MLRPGTATPSRHRPRPRHPCPHRGTPGERRPRGRSRRNVQQDRTAGEPRWRGGRSPRRRRGHGGRGGSAPPAAPVPGPGEGTTPSAEPPPSRRRGAGRAEATRPTGRAADRPWDPSVARAALESPDRREELRIMSIPENRETPPASELRRVGEGREAEIFSWGEAQGPSSPPGPIRG